MSSELYEDYLNKLFYTSIAHSARSDKEIDRILEDINGSSELTEDEKDRLWAYGSDHKVYD